MRYANVGHDLPYLWHGGDAEELRGQGDGLGPYAGNKLRAKGDGARGDEIALFYSDGLVEAHNPYGEIFGFPRLRTLLAEHREEASLSNLLERNFTHSPERAGSRRTTSPSLPYDV